MAAGTTAAASTIGADAWPRLNIASRGSPGSLRLIAITSVTTTPATKPITPHSRAARPGLRATAPSYVRTTPHPSTFAAIPQLV